MPLVTCPDCGHAVSDMAPACPSCGRPIAQPPPPPPAQQPPAAEPAPDKTPGVLMLCAAGLVALGSFLPWAKAVGLFGGLSLSGMQGDGVLTLVGGVILLGCGISALARAPSAGLKAGVALVSLLVGALVIHKLVRFGELDDARGMVQVGEGLYAVGLGALLGLVAAVVGKSAPEARKEKVHPPKGSTTLSWKTALILIGGLIMMFVVAALLAD